MKKQNNFQTAQNSHNDKIRYAQLRCYKQAELDTENQIVDGTKEIITEKGNIVQLRDIINNNKLIFKYSELNCSVCIDSQIVVVNKLANIISPEKIIFLSSYNQNSNLYRFKRLNSLKSEIYNMNEGLGLKIDSLNVPYYFIMSPECKISNIFIPDKMDMEMTIRYMETVKRYFVYNQ